MDRVNDRLDEMDVKLKERNQNMKVNVIRVVNVIKKRFNSVYCEETAAGVLIRKLYTYSCITLSVKRFCTAYPLVCIPHQFEYILFAPPPPPPPPPQEIVLQRLQKWLFRW